MKRSVGLVILVAGIAPWLGGCYPNSFQHNLVQCLPTAGTAAVMSLSPGLTCSESKNTFKVEMTAKLANQMDGCLANVGAPWGAWAAGKIASKITAADAATISKADVTFKGTMFGSCDDDANSYPRMPGSGKVTFYDGTGAKVKGGSGTFFGNVTTSGIVSGLITKGIGAGAAIEINLPVDPGDTTASSCVSASLCSTDPFGNNSKCTAAGVPTPCCTGPKTGTCLNPITTINLKTDATTYLRIQIPNSADCTAAGVPLSCCTGVGTGTCA
jgi:hypothetical protein